MRQFFSLLELPNAPCHLVRAGESTNIVLNRRIQFGPPNSFSNITGQFVVGGERNHG